MLYQLQVLCIVGYAVCSELGQGRWKSWPVARHTPSQDWKLVPHKRICVTASANVMIVFHFEWCVRHIFMQSYFCIVIIALSTAVLSSPTFVKALFYPLLPDICKSIAFF